MAQKRMTVAIDHHTNRPSSAGWLIGTAGAVAGRRWAATLIGPLRSRRAA